MSKTVRTPEEAMRRAIRLARRGFPAPNPRVGCVLVQDGEVVGKGFHAFAGAPHAEVMALRQAGVRARGATAYVTLEPCDHTGRTGPCSLALMEAGVAAVTYAVADPNPRAAGGAARLRAAGIAVTEGLCGLEARAGNEVFLAAQARRRPWVVAKVAMGLDGRIALPDGQSRWITGEAARRAGHRLRAELGCVVVGAGTWLHDQPQLTARIPGVRNQPLRAVWDTRGGLEAPGFEVVTGSPEAVLGHLFQLGQIGVLLEGGPGLWSAFLAAGLVDQLEIFLAPRVLGTGPVWADLSAIDPLAESPAWRVVKTRQIGEDVQMSLRPRA